MRVLASVSLLLFLCVYRAKFTNCQSIYKITPLVTRCKKKNRLCFLKMHYYCHKNSTTSINFFECLLKHDVFATLCIIWQCFNSNRFCHLYRKHTVCFQDFVHSHCYSSNMQLTNTYCSYACGASKQCTEFLYMLSAKDLSYCPLF